tara:strand:- start:310 stop:525 length:216 start_codon:yes stop_codon:yes gene_type:complete
MQRIAKALNYGFCAIITADFGEGTEGLVVKYCGVRWLALWPQRPPNSSLWIGLNLFKNLFKILKVNIWEIS